MRRRIITQESVFPYPLFYASLIGKISPEVIDSSYNYTYNSKNVSASSSGLILESTNAFVKYNPVCPANTDITCSCWVKRTSKEGGVNYSFGTATSDNSRYRGLQTAYYSNEKLGQEYCAMWWDNVLGSTWNIPLNTWTFISWSLIYNNNSYTFKGYENGVFVSERTVTNSQWLGMADTVFAIGHGTNNDMKGEYKHFSVFPLLNNRQILQLYQSGGIPPAPVKELILDLPLSYDGDNTERISGSNSWTNASKMGWNSNYGGYSFIANQNSSARLTGVNIPSFTKRSTTYCTIEADLYVVSYEGTNKRISICGGYGSNEDNFIFYYDPSASSPGTNGILVSHTWAHIKVIRRGLTVTYYVDGNLVGYNDTFGETTGMSANIFIPNGARWAADRSQIILKNLEIYNLT